MSEILIEKVAIGLYAYWLTTDGGRRGLPLSPANQRRVLAWLQNLCIAFGIFGIFHFLGEGDVGKVFVDQIWWANGFYLNHVLWYLTTLGYCFNQFNLELERRNPMTGF